MIVLGVDPGMTGALALVDTEGPRLVASLPMPVIRVGKHAIVDGAAVLDWLDGRKLDAIVIEDVSARPGQGSASGFQFGRMAGGIEAVLVSVGAPVAHARPSEWKRRAGLTKDKAASLDVARLRFGALPEFRRKKDDGVAEAALVALFGRAA